MFIPFLSLSSSLWSKKNKEIDNDLMKVLPVADCLPIRRFKQ